MAEYKILVVDDEEPIANILEFNLKKEGYDVIVANDGEKAVELAFNVTRFNVTEKRWNGSM